MLRTALVIFLLLTCQSLFSQVVFQVERLKEIVPEKYYEGSILMYQEKVYPGEWFKRKISEIKDKEKMLFFEDGYFLEIKNITMIRTQQPIMNGVSKGLYGFGGSWLVFGAIASLREDYEPGWDTVAIGGLSLLGGYVLSKHKYKKTKINKRNRLRIIDISWPEIAP